MTEFWISMGDEIIKNGLAAMMLFLVLYGIYKIARPVLSSFLNSVKAQTDANMVFAKSITKLAAEIGQFTETNIDMLKGISKKMDAHKAEIISHIKKEL